MIENEYFKDKILVITGGTGSFGSALVDRLIHTDIKEIRIFSRDENKQFEMNYKYNNSKLKFFIGDVRNKDSLYKALEGADYLFHASAMKQVPSCEEFPVEAVLTNIIGSNNVLDVAIESNIKKVVVLSTDKACYPISTMGMTKGIMEKIAIDKSKRQKKTMVYITRFGNLLLSRGSVMPTFINQAKNNKPLTLTDSKMARIIMTIDEAIDLVIKVFKDGNNGEVYIKKAKWCMMEDIAKIIIELNNSESKIIETGIRPGEKLEELLMTEEEKTRAEDFGEYISIKPDYEKYVSDKEIKATGDKLNIEELKELIKKVL